MCESRVHLRHETNYKKTLWVALLNLDWTVVNLIRMHNDNGEGTIVHSHNLFIVSKIWYKVAELLKVLIWDYEVLSLVSIR